MSKYYDQLESIFEELVDNENGLITEEGLRYFTILNNRTNRLHNHSTVLRDYTKQASDSHRSKLDYAQNRLVRVFTVITTIFLPLTLIVGWYGMNFDMPEFGLKYGYPMVIALSVIVCSIITIIFKKHKWF